MVHNTLGYSDCNETKVAADEDEARAVRRTWRRSEYEFDGLGA